MTSSTTPAESLRRIFDAIALAEMMNPGRPVSPGVVDEVFGPVWRAAGEAMGAKASEAVASAGDKQWDLSELLGVGIGDAAAVVTDELAAAIAVVQLLAQQLAGRTGTTADEVLRDVLRAVEGDPN